MTGPGRLRRLQVGLLLTSLWGAACGGEIALQVVEGQLDLFALAERALLVQARHADGALAAAAPTDASGAFVLFVPPATLTLTALGRQVHRLGTLKVCEVGEPVQIAVNPSPSPFSEACLSARGALAECRRRVGSVCAEYEAEVRTCRSGQPVDECTVERSRWTACERSGRSCESERSALDDCRNSACETRLVRFLDAGCLEPCRSEEEAVLATCAEPQNELTSREVGCSSSP